MCVKTSCGCRLRQAWVAGWLFLCHAVSCGFSLTFGVFYLPLIDTFDSDKAATAFVGSLNYGFLCLAGPLASFLISRSGIRVTLALGGALSAVGVITTSFASNIYIVYVTFGVIAGVGYGISFTTAAVAVTLHFPKHRATFMGVTLAGVSIGSFVNPVLSELLMHAYGWRGAMLIYGALTLNVVTGALALGKTPPLVPSNSDPQIQRNPKQSVLFNIDVFILILNNFLFNFGMQSMFTFLAPLAEYRGYDSQTAALVLSSMSASNCVSRFILGCVANIRRVDKVLLYMISYAIAGVCVLTLPFWNHLVPLVIFVVIYGIFSAAYGPVLTEVTAILFGVENFPKVYGFLLLGMGCGSTLGPPAAGWLVEMTGNYAHVFLLAGTSIITSGAVVLAVKRRSCPGPALTLPGHKLVMETDVVTANAQKIVLHSNQDTYADSEQAV